MNYRHGITLVKRVLLALCLAASLNPACFNLAAEEKNQGAVGLNLGFLPGVKLGYTRYTDSGFMWGIKGDAGTIFLISSVTLSADAG